MPLKYGFLTGSSQPPTAIIATTTELLHESPNGHLAVDLNPQAVGEVTQHAYGSHVTAQAVVNLPCDSSAQLCPQGTGDKLHIDANVFNDRLNTIMLDYSSKRDSNDHLGSHADSAIRDNPTLPSSHGGQPLCDDLQPSSDQVSCQEDEHRDSILPLDAQIPDDVSMSHSDNQHDLHANDPQPQHEDDQPTSDDSSMLTDLDSSDGSVMEIDSDSECDNDNSEPETDMEKLENEESPASPSHDPTTKPEKDSETKKANKGW